MAAVSVGNEVFAFLVWPEPHPDFARVINARTAGKAKYQEWLDITDSWPDVPITAMRARKVGPPEPDRDFQRVAEYRGLPDLHVGQRVRAEGGVGAVVGSTSSCNFAVLYDDDSPRFGGQTLSVHPAYLEMLPATPGEEESDGE